MICWWSQRVCRKARPILLRTLSAEGTLRDLTGVIGLYFHGNEQYRHIPYLYNYVKQPWKTQALVRRIQSELYRPFPAGLCGMDDITEIWKDGM